MGSFNVFIFFCGRLFISESLYLDWKQLHRLPERPMHLGIMGAQLKATTKRCDAIVLRYLKGIRVALIGPP